MNSAGWIFFFKKIQSGSLMLHQIEEGGGGSQVCSCVSTYLTNSSTACCLLTGEGRTATCAGGSTLGGFAYTFTSCLGSAPFLHFKTLLVEDLYLCQISSDHRLSSFIEKKFPRPFFAFHQQHVRTGVERDCFQ